MVILSFQEFVMTSIYHQTVLQVLHNDVGHPRRDKPFMGERLYGLRITAEFENMKNGKVKAGVY